MKVRIMGKQPEVWVIRKERTNHVTFRVLFDIFARDLLCCMFSQRRREERWVNRVENVILSVIEAWERLQHELRESHPSIHGGLQRFCCRFCARQGLLPDLGSSQKCFWQTDQKGVPKARHEISPGQEQEQRRWGEISEDRRRYSELFTATFVDQNVRLIIRVIRYQRRSTFNSAREC